MLRNIATLCITASVLLLPLQVAADCNLSNLTNAVDRYLVAQSTGQPQWLSKVMGGLGVTYLENDAAISISEGMLSKPMRIDWSHSFFDPIECASFTELISSDPDDPHVIATQIRHFPGTDASVSAFDSVTSGPQDRLFNASHTLHYALLPENDFGVIPPERRDARDVVVKAADAYLDSLGAGVGSNTSRNTTVRVPWGYPCVRVEGGLKVGNGTCQNVGGGVVTTMKSNMPNRRYVVDESLGLVNIFSTATALNLAADSHLFRVEGGKLRYVHSVTNCNGNFNCGQGDLPPELGEDVGY